MERKGGTDLPALSRQPDDELHRLARAMLSMVPGLGGVLLEVFTGLVAEPAQARRDALLRELMIRLIDLEQRSTITFDDLSQRPDFLATFVRCIQQASREIEEEKIRYLKNAVLNTAIGDNIESAIRSTLLSLLDRVTTLHLFFLGKVAITPTLIDQLVRGDLKKYREPSECKNPKPSGDADLPYYDGEEVEMRHAILGELFTMQLIRYDVASAGEDRQPRFGSQSGQTVIPSVTGIKLLQLIRDVE